MNIKRLIIHTGIGAALSLLLLSGCTKRPTLEEMAVLEQQIAAAESAEKKVSDLEREKANLEAELSSQQQTLADHESEFAEIKRRMEERGLQPGGAQ